MSVEIAGHILCYSGCIGGVGETAIFNSRALLRMIMDCPACDTPLTLEVGPEQPLSTSLRDAVLRAEADEHLEITDIVDRVLERAQQPRTDHRDAHLDELMATVVDRYGMESVHTVIRRILVDRMPFRTAIHDLELSNVDGVRIGTTAGQFLDELNTQDDG